MPPWLQVFYLIVGLVVVPSAVWLVRDHLKFKTKILLDFMSLRKDIAASEQLHKQELVVIQERCHQHEHEFTSLFKALRRTDKNMVRIGAHLDVKDLDTSE